MDNEIGRASVVIEADSTPLERAIGNVKKTVENIGDGVRNVGYAIEGSFERAKDSVREIDRVGQTALVGLSAGIFALAKDSFGELTKYSDSAKKSQDRLNESINKIKLTIGQVVQPLVDVVGTFATMASQVPHLTTGFLAFVGVLGGATGLIALFTKLKTATVALKMSFGSLVGIISIVAGVAGVLMTTFNNYDKTLKESEEDTKKIKEATDEYNKAMAEVNDEIASARKNISETTFEYRQSLKKILDDHEKTMNELTKQIEDANKEYNDAVAERNASFAVEQAKEEKEHQKKVNEIMSQINFLQRYNNKYNQEKLEQLKFALAEENNQYEKQTEAEKAELDLQNRLEKEKLDARLKEYQSELNDEYKLLNKHRDLLNTVRDEILEDEVEKLTRQYEKTLETYNESVAQARIKGKEAGEEWAKAFADAQKQTSERIYKSEGRTIFDDIALMWSGTDTMRGIKDIFNFNWKPTPTTSSGGRASGGFTGVGDKYEVAGYVHKGEYVLPQEMVDQNTGTPKGVGNTFNIYVDGVFATSASERRKVALDIQQALLQVENKNLARAN